MSLLVYICLFGIQVQELFSKEINSSCGDASYNADFTLLDQTKREDDPMRVFKASRALTWCEAYRACADNGSSLATFPDPRSQKMTFELWDYTNAAWIAGRRMEPSYGFVEVDGKLSRFEHDSVDIRKEDHSFVSVQLYGDISYRIPSSRKLQNFLCESKDGDQEIEVTKDEEYYTWYEAQNHCAMNGYRLMSSQKLLQENKNSYKAYWFGIYYRPWIWINGSKNHSNNEFWDVSPILYSSWKVLPRDRSRADDVTRCLVLNIHDGYVWEDRPCNDTTVEHFVCRVEKNENNENEDRFLIIIIIGSVIGLLLFVLIITMASRHVIVMERKSQIDVTTLATSQPDITMQCSGDNYDPSPESSPEPLRMLREAQGMGQTQCGIVDELKGHMKAIGTIPEDDYACIRESKLY